MTGFVVDPRAVVIGCAIALVLGLALWTAFGAYPNDLTDGDAP